MYCNVVGRVSADYFLLTANTRKSETMTTFRPMRRRRQQLPEEACIEILSKSTSGVLSVLGDDGYPYGVPLSYVMVGRRLYFHSALTGHKVDAVRRYDKASFTIIYKDSVQPCEFTTYYQSVVCFGRVRIVEDADEKMSALRQLGERYNPGDAEGLQKEMEQGAARLLMIAFDIESLTGKAAIELLR